MGAIRGKRNRDQDRYWHERRKATQAGMMAVSLENVAMCAKCRHLGPLAEMHKGWCLPCVADWVDTTDPWLVFQAQAKLPPTVVPRTMMKQIEELAARIAEPIKDADFLPLTQFMGHQGIGSQKAMWNFLQALYTFELETTGEAAKLGTIYPNTVHLCGRHAPVQRMSIQGFLSRIHSAGDEFALWKRDKRFVDYIRGFVLDNRLGIYQYQRTSVDVFDREYRRQFTAKYGKTHFDKHQPVVWPFESERHGKLREEGKMEELPDFVMQIGQLVPVSMPSLLREDLCQDLAVAVLTGEITVDELRIERQMKRYVAEAFKNHPLKYGRYSLDQPFDRSARSAGERGDSFIDFITHEDISPERADRGWLADLCIDPDENFHWHHGRDRTKGLTTLGDIARHNNDGHAIDGPNVIRTPEEIDEDIADVFYADQHPQWRRKLSD